MWVKVEKKNYLLIDNYSQKKNVYKCALMSEIKVHSYLIIILFIINLLNIGFREIRSIVRANYISHLVKIWLHGKC